MTMNIDALLAPVSSDNPCGDNWSITRITGDGAGQYR